MTEKPARITRMRRRLLVGGVVVLAIGAAALSKGCAVKFDNRNPISEQFPSVVGQSLEKEEVRLPEDFAGEPVVLLVGYLQRTQFDIDRWILGLIQADVRAKILEVPTIPGLATSLASGWIDDGMRSGIPEEDWAVVITLYGASAKPVAKFTGNRGGQTARVLVLDADGEVVWFTDRGYSATQALDVKRVTDALMGE